MKITRANRWLLATNLLALLSLGVLVLSSDRVKTALGIQAAKGLHPIAVDFRNNPFYQPQLDFIQHQRLPSRIVFLGDSHSALTDWRELLGRCDVANQGIRGDVAAGMEARAEWVIAREPAICFLEAGSNDISYGIPEAVTLEKLTALVDTLRHHQILPVLHTITRVTPAHPNKAFNAQVTALNRRLRSWCAKKQIGYIDLDRATDSAGFFKTTFAAPDGVHYSYAMYRLWANEIQNVLHQQGI